MALSLVAGIGLVPFRLCWTAPVDVRSKAFSQVVSLAVFQIRKVGEYFVA
jgi:hypothetical protein